MEILDRELTLIPEKKSILFIGVKTYCLSIICLPALNVFLFYFNTVNSGGWVDTSGALYGSLGVVYMLAPFTSFMLAIVFAVLPYKGKPYRQKYLPVALFIYLILNVASTLINGIRATQ
jgi:hypothetical protein